MNQYDYFFFNGKKIEYKKILGEQEMKEYWIQTFTGKKFDLKNPDPRMVDRRDIAHALSLTCRFSGHSNMMYSVAHHSINVMELVCYEYKLDALLHDAAEAYICDITTPFKWLVPSIKIIENKIQIAIRQRFNLPDVMSDDRLKVIKRADMIMLATEKRDLMGDYADCDWVRYDLPEPFSEKIIRSSWKLVEKHFNNTLDILLMDRKTI